MLRTDDGGDSWVGIPAPSASVGDVGRLPAGGVDLLRFADQRDGWAAGSSLYATHDGGASWHTVALVPKVLAVRSLETSGGYVYAVVNGCRLHYEGNCLPSSALYAATIGSDRWTRVTAQVPYTQDMNQVVGHGADWYVPTVDGVLRGHGTTELSARPNPCPVDTDADDRPPPTLAVVDTDHLDTDHLYTDHLDAVCESGGAAGSARYQLYGSTDGGAHWTRSGGSHWEQSGLGGVADNGHGVLVLAVAGGNSAILRTTDDGTSLHAAAVSTPPGGLLWTDLGFTTASQAVVVLEDSGVYLSRDAGRSWSPIRF